MTGSFAFLDYQKHLQLRSFLKEFKFKTGRCCYQQ